MAPFYGLQCSLPKEFASLIDEVMCLELQDIYNKKPVCVDHFRLLTELRLSFRDLYYCARDRQKPVLFDQGPVLEKRCDPMFVSEMINVKDFSAMERRAFLQSSLEEYTQYLCGDMEGVCIVKGERNLDHKEFWKNMQESCRNCVNRNKKKITITIDELPKRPVRSPFRISKEGLPVMPAGPFSYWDFWQELVRAKKRQKDARELQRM